MYRNRRRIRGRRGRRLMRQRGERIERSFAHLYDTGGMRRTHLRGHTNILKRAADSCGWLQSRARHASPDRRRHAARPAGPPRGRDFHALVVPGRGPSARSRDLGVASSHGCHAQRIDIFNARGKCVSRRDLLHGLLNDHDLWNWCLGAQVLHEGATSPLEAHPETARPRRSARQSLQPIRGPGERRELIAARHVLPDQLVPAGDLHLMASHHATGG